MVAPEISSLSPANTNCSPHSVATESRSPSPQDSGTSKNTVEPLSGVILSLHARDVVITIVDRSGDAECDTTEDTDALHTGNGDANGGSSRVQKLLSAIGTRRSVVSTYTN